METLGVVVVLVIVAGFVLFGASLEPGDESESSAGNPVAEGALILGLMLQDFFWSLMDRIFRSKR